MPLNSILWQSFFKSHYKDDAKPARRGLAFGKQQRVLVLDNDKAPVLKIKSSLLEDKFQECSSIRLLDNSELGNNPCLRRIFGSTARFSWGNQTANERFHLKVSGIAEPDMLTFIKENVDDWEISFLDSNDTLPAQNHTSSPSKKTKASGGDVHEVLESLRTNILSHLDPTESTTALTSINRTIGFYDSKDYTSAALECRKILEMIIRTTLKRARIPMERNTSLHTMLLHMQNNLPDINYGVRGFSNMTHLIRSFGNDAAHASNNPPPGKDAMMSIIGMLSHLANVTSNHELTARPTA